MQRYKGKKRDGDWNTGKKKGKEITKERKREGERDRDKTGAACFLLVFFFKLSSHKIFDGNSKTFINK